MNKEEQVEEIFSQEQIEDIQHKQEESYITDAQEFLTFCQKQKKIKIMDECNPIINHVYLKDISLHKKGPLQDKMYAKIGIFYRNIRRGNTLCQIFNKDETQQLFFCRRGMKKFYDLQPEYLRTGANMTSLHNSWRKRIFEKVDKNIEKDVKIHIYCLFKQNGEHCQISFIQRLDCWLFASKNVAILARTEKDLQDYYLKERFYWAKLVGVEFFNIMKGWEEKQVEQFKKDINGYTLLGQHCGYEKHQHITKYDKIQIIFYGLVNNIGEDHCQPVQKCRQLLNKYKLTMSYCKEIKNLIGKNKVYESMYSCLKEVAEGSMQEKGQGSVMYLVAENKEEQKTIGMCKLKTTEYLIFRRMREMLKLNIARSGSTANNFEKYKFDIDNLVEHYFKPPHKLNYYFKIAESAFKEVSLKQNQITQTYLRYKFVDFINNINNGNNNKKSIKKQLPQRIILICLPFLNNFIQKYCKKNEIKVQYMYRNIPNQQQQLSKTVVHILHMIPRLPQIIENNTHIVICKYSQEQCKQIVCQLMGYTDISKSHLISFIKSQDKEKNIRLLYQKIRGFQMSCVKNNIAFTNISGSGKSENVVNSLTKLRVFEQQTTKQEYKYHKFIIMPLLIPGSGKSTFMNQLFKQQKDYPSYDFKCINSDQMRRQLMEKHEQVDLNSDNSQKLFYKTKQEALELYKVELFKQINTEPVNKDQIVYVDRAFSPLTIISNIQQIIQCQKGYISIIILTQNYQQIKLNDNNYPFSLKYLMVCLKRCIQRENHQTMMNNPYQVAKLVFKFYQMMVNFNQKHILKTLENKIPLQIVKLNFVNDQEEKVINQHLKKKVEECLRMVEPGFDSKDSNSFLQLIELMYKYNMHVQQKNSIPANLCQQLMKKINNFDN